MNGDPHEAGLRAPPYAKDPADESFFEAMNLALADASLPRAPTASTELPLIYIVGAPRSGTTLLSQLLSKYLPVGYINNLISRFWLRPSAGVRLSESLLGPDAGTAIELKSRFGTTTDLIGPHEFGYFWRHWLRLDEAATHSLAPKDLARIDVGGLVDALEGEILGSFGRPVVFKNVICGLCAPFLSMLHPRSLFVHIDRDPLLTAASILNSRLERYGSYSNWWSLKPSTYPFLDASGPEDEVARQVVDCRREIDQALSQPGVHAVRLSYESLCADPAAELDRIAGSLAAWTPGFARRQLAIEPLQVSSRLSLPADLQARLRQALA